MNTRSIVLCALLLLPAANGPAAAHDREHGSIHLDCCQDPVAWGPRHSTNRAHVAITTDDGAVTLLLDDDGIAMQFSERTQRRINRELRDARDEDDDGPLGNALKSAVISGVRSLLNQSAELALEDVDDVTYRNGRLVITAYDGSEPYAGASVDDRYVLESYSARDAQRFVRAFERMTRR